MINHIISLMILAENNLIQVICQMIFIFASVKHSELWLFNNESPQKVTRKNTFSLSHDNIGFCLFTFD